MAQPVTQRKKALVTGHIHTCHLAHSLRPALQAPHSSSTSLLLPTCSVWNMWSLTPHTHFPCFLCTLVLSRSGGIQILATAVLSSSHSSLCTPGCDLRTSSNTLRRALRMLPRC